MSEIIDTFAAPSAAVNRPTKIAPSSAPEERSPFDIEGIDLGLTREDIIEAIHEGRGNDRWYETKALRSPLDVGSVKLDMTTDEIVEFIHEGRGNDRW